MTTSLTVTTATADETRALGARLAGLLCPGDVVALSGDLGAGKTALVQGMGRGMGVPHPITSPTFMLQRIHHGTSHTLVHLDVYRLNQLHEVAGLGDEALAPDVVTVIEWGDTIAGMLPADRIDIELRHQDDVLADAAMDALAPDGGLVDLPRTVVVTLRGTWAARRVELADVLE